MNIRKMDLSDSAYLSALTPAQRRREMARRAQQTARNEAIEDEALGYENWCGGRPWGFGLPEVDKQPWPKSWPPAWEVRRERWRRVWSHQSIEETLNEECLAWRLLRDA